MTSPNPADSTSEPPPFLRPPIVEQLALDELAPGVVHRVRLVMTQNATGNETMVPVFVVRAEGDPTPVVGVTAAIHGNELNGIRVTQELAARLSEDPFPLLRGTVIAVPLLNVPGYLNSSRGFSNGADLNRMMPGRADGNESELYAHRILDRIVRHCDYLFDLHTASFGRVNTHYVRCDTNSPTAVRLASVLAPQIVLHSPDADGTLRGTAAERGIHALTVEIGDPQRIQGTLVRSAVSGLTEALSELGLLAPTPSTPSEEPIRCVRSSWMYTDRGGLLTVLPELSARVAEGEVVATLRNIWGDIVRHYRAPAAGVVIGKSTNPAAGAGSRIVHLGIEDV